MKATELLEAQHRKVEAIFAQLEGDEHGQHATQKKLVEELANDLAAHMTIEQELFYPAVHAIDAKLVAESLEEHALAELGLRRLLAAGSDEAFKARVTALKELIQHHVKEEESELFPEVEKAMDADKLDELGEHMQALFDSVVEAGFKSVVPKGVVLASADGKPKRKRAPAKKTQHARRKSAA
jgi:iron-sulfur cluster repair protein YtfE (RIC family)